MSFCSSSLLSRLSSSSFLLVAGGSAAFVPCGWGFAAGAAGGPTPAPLRGTMPGGKSAAPEPKDFADAGGAAEITGFLAGAGGAGAALGAAGTGAGTGFGATADRPGRTSSPSGFAGRIRAGGPSSSPASMASSAALPPALALDFREGVGGVALGGFQMTCQLADGTHSRLCILCILRLLRLLFRHWVTLVADTTKGAGATGN